MSHAVRFGSAASLLIATACPVLAQSAVCADFKWSVERETKAFAASDLATASSGGSLPDGLKAAAVTLAKQDSVSFAVAPTHKPKHNPPYAGVFQIPTLPAPGPYQVTISDDAWIDVVQNGKILKQTGFTGSHTCTAVRKSVRFDLGPGPAAVMISDAAVASLKLEVLPPPSP